MPILSGLELEEYGKTIFNSMGLNCLSELNNVRLRDLDPSAPFPRNEHLEIDYLIPYRTYCLIGEITSRSNANDVVAKYRRFLRHYDFIASRQLNDAFWTALGVPGHQLRHFRNISEFRGFYIVAGLQDFDVALESAPNIVCFHADAWRLLQEYSKSIGRYSELSFISSFSIQRRRGHRPIRVGEDQHSLIKTNEKRIAGGSIQSANIYTFEISPYEILPIAAVFRRDLLPDISPDEERKYQRPLLPEKLKKIRRHLLTDPHFMFPNSILVVLSNDCSYDGTALQIPEVYGAITIIDGQHRLFSYADHDLEQTLTANSKILVTAIEFIGADEPSIREYSARTFIEINMNQTSIPSSHLGVQSKSG